MVRSNKSLLILSSNNNFISTLTYHLNDKASLFSICSKHDICEFNNNHYKANIVIIDNIEITSPIFADYTINLNQQKNDYVFFEKPFRLQAIIDYIHAALNSEHIFCIINKQYIFNQRLAIFENKNSIISLTEKENELLALLFLEQKIDKDTILKKIWNYNSDIDTQTLESHIYRINKKLDLDLIKIGNEQCFLHNFAIN